MQGVQIWTGADDAWGGFAGRYVEALRDEMGKQAIWAWGVEEEKGQDSRVKPIQSSITISRGELTAITGQTASSNNQRGQVNTRDLIASFNVYPAVNSCNNAAFISPA